MTTARLASGFAALGLLMSPILTAPVEARPAKAVRSNIPPFCVLIGGPRGFPLPQVCRFYDYRECLQAAADLRGNCVINVDYPDKITSAPGANWSRPN